MELQSLLQAAESAPPASRIEWRDRIAAHGSLAIEGVRPWLASDSLAAFAIRVIERAGLDGEAELAAKALRSARKRVPEGVEGDVEWALLRLRTATRQRSAPAPAPVIASRAPSRPVRRSVALGTGAVRRRTR